MKTNFECIPCFVRQSLDAAKTLEIEEETTNTLLRRVLKLLPGLDWSLPPPVIGRDIHRAIREILGDKDPYLRRKIEDTVRALELLPQIEAAIASSTQPFTMAVKYSIAGNAIDLGAKTGMDIDINKTFQNALDKELDQGAVLRLESAILEAKSVLFLADNAGELVFDRPLLEQIGSNKVTVAVRGAPVINDATLDDARRSGISDRFRVISNGSDTPGTWLDDCSNEFVDEFENSDLIIAKGQGNYESLGTHPRKIFFLFLTKCSLVSKQLQAPVHTYIVGESGRKKKIEATQTLERLKTWFTSYVNRFHQGSETFRHSIDIKIGHTRRVCLEILDLAESLNLSQEETALGESLALLHDVGRFEQYQRYNTFSDWKSVDYAELGIRILERNGIIEWFDPSERELVPRCIGNHNRLQLPQGGDERCLFYSRLLRDADKLDIWRVVTEYYAESARPRNPILELEMTESTEISSTVAEAAKAGRMVELEALHTTADFKVLQMSWIFDIHFPRTFQLIDERKYLEKIADSLPKNELSASLYRSLRGYLDTRLEEL